MCDGEWVARRSRVRRARQVSSPAHSGLVFMIARAVGATFALSALLTHSDLAAQDFDRAWYVCASGSTTSSVALGDLDSDGDLDVVFGNGRHWAEDSHYSLNRGDGFLVQSLPMSTAQKTYSIALADLDGDQDLDAVEATDFGDYVFILENDGRGIFSKSAIRLDDSELLQGRSLAARHVVIADFDDDGRPDPAIISRGTGNYVFHNRGDGVYSPRMLEGPGRQTIKAATGDIDRDGDIDLAVAARGRSVLYINEGGFRFSVRELPGDEAEGTAVALGDVDDNGWLDLALGIEGGVSRMYMNPLSPQARVDEWGDPLEGVRALQFADMDGDGDLDMVAGTDRRGFEMVNDSTWFTRLLDGRNQIYWNDGTGQFMDSTPFGQSGNTTRDIAVGDLNSDRRLDIVEANDCGGSVVLFGSG